MALPPLMFMIGIGFYYHGESKQRKGSPVLEESRDFEAIVDGLSVINSVSGKNAKHYFWFDVEGDRRGARVSQEASVALEQLESGDPVTVSLAPMVAGSKKLWAYRVQHEGSDLLAPVPAE